MEQSAKMDRIFENFKINHFWMYWIRSGIIVANSPPPPPPRPSSPLSLSLFHSSDPRVNWLQRYTCKWSNDKNLTFSLPGPNLIDSSSRFSRKRKNEKPNKKITVIIAKWEHFLIILIHFNYPAKEFIYFKKKKSLMLIIKNHFHSRVWKKNSWSS